jgi:hypothetical protein
MELRASNINFERLPTIKFYAKVFSKKNIYIYMGNQRHWKELYSHYYINTYKHNARFRCDKSLYNMAHKVK